METIYVKLKNEDLEVWRPVKVSLSDLDGIYFIEWPPINLVPEEEEWEFLPGMFVTVQDKVSGGSIIKVAVSQMI